MEFMRKVFPMNVPSDLQLRYYWSAATVRPPYHYSLTILIGPGPEGQVNYIPDYPNHNPPIWQEKFSIQPADLEAMYALMLKNKAFRPEWKRRPEGFVGGSNAWMDGNAGEQKMNIPAGLTPPDASEAQPLFETVHALVPQSIWDKLESKRQKYIQEHL
jgi:hypothetical protein